MKIATGDYVRTPRFLTVKIKKVYPSTEEMYCTGFEEPTHFRDDDYEVCGKTIGLNQMEFAAACKQNCKTDGGINV